MIDKIDLITKAFQSDAAVDLKGEGALFEKTLPIHERK
jgi:hypothetical protein